MAELAEHGFRHVGRALGAEIDADALGADQPHHLLDAGDQRRRRVVEQQMRLVEEEDELRLVEIAFLRKTLEQFGQQPQQEGGVEPRPHHQLVRGEDVDGPAPARVLAHEVDEIEFGLADEMIAALGLEREQGALDRTDRRGGDVAVLDGELLRVIVDEGQQRAQVLEVDQQQAIVVGDLEGEVEHARLGVVEFEHAAEQDRPDLRHRGADRMALFAEQVPEDHRRRLVGEAVDAERGHALADAGRIRAGL